MPYVLDAAACVCADSLNERSADHSRAIILTLHPGEMAATRKTIVRDYEGAAINAARRFNASIALRSTETWTMATRIADKLFRPPVIKELQA